MGCGQSKTSASSSASSKTFNHRKPRINNDDDLHRDRPNYVILSENINSPIQKESRIVVEDRANANNTTQDLRTGGGGGGGGGGVSLENPSAAGGGGGGVLFVNRGSDVDVQQHLIGGEEDQVMPTEVMLLQSAVMNPSDPPPPPSSNHFNEEKQVHSYSASSTSSSAPSSSSSSSLVTGTSCRPTARDRPNRLTSNLSNLTASQIEFFRMVDEKIAQGKEYESEDEQR